MNLFQWLDLIYVDGNVYLYNSKPFKLTIIFQPSSQSPSSEANATNDCARFVFKTTKIKAKNWSLRLLHMVGISLSYRWAQLRPHYHSHCHHFRLDHNHHQPHPCNLWPYQTWSSGLIAALTLAHTGIIAYALHKEQQEETFKFIGEYHYCREH